MKSFSSLFPVALLALLLTLRLPATAQAPTWQSARAVAVAAAASNNSVVTATAVDAAGNVYLVGAFTNTVVLGGTTLTSLGSYDVFLAKFNPASNQFAWAQRAGGAGFDYANALVMSGTSVYVAGYFDSPTAGFGSATLANTGNPGTDDVFVAKLTDTGSFMWAQRAGGIGNEGANYLAVNGNSVYVAGYFASAAAGFGPTTLTSAGSDDVFVAKLTDAGGFTWAQRAGGTGSDYATALAVSGTSVYVAGSFSSATAGFGTATLTNTNTNFSDVFVAKLTDTGSTGGFTWAQRAGGVGNDYAAALAVSGASVYATGSFSSATAGFGTATLVNAGANTNTSDVFVAKLTDAGNTGSFVWAQPAGGTGGDYAGSVFVSGTIVYVAGSFDSPTASFGAINLFNPNPNTSLGFLASLTDATLTATTTAAGLREAAALFPNPAHHAATLRLPAGSASAPLTLTDALGRAVRRYPAPAGAEATLDLGGLPAGLYLLRGAGPAQRLVIE